MNKESVFYYPGQTGYQPTGVPVGGVVTAKEPVVFNIGRKTLKLKVRNTGDRPVQVGSHFHFFEVNRFLCFTRSKAFGMHLNIPATTAVRFEPGDEKEVELVDFGGKRRIVGFNALTRGYAGTEEQPGYFPVRLKAMRRMRKMGFRTDDDCQNMCCCCEPPKTPHVPSTMMPNMTPQMPENK